MHIIRKSSLVATPWKNGGGITHEIIRDAAVCEVFRWRLSIAQIDASGPFSNFAGYRRSMVLLRGAGIRLHCDAAAPVTLTKVGDIVEFDGASRTECQLLNGTCTDLNLMVAQSMRHVSARVERLQGSYRLPGSGLGIILVFSINGGLSVVDAGDATTELEPWDLAVLPGGGGKLLPASPASVDQQSAGPGAYPLVFLAALDDNP